MGEVADDLHPRSRFLKELNARPRAPGVRYHVGTGRQGLLAEADRKRIEEELARWASAPGTNSKTRKTLLQIISSEEFRRGDGVVAGVRSELSGAASERIFDLNHFDLIHLDGNPPEAGRVFRWICASLGWPAERKEP